MVVWYIFPRFGMLYQEKSGNPALPFTASEHIDANGLPSGIVFACIAVGPDIESRQGKNPSDTYQLTNLFCFLKMQNRIIASDFISLGNEIDITFQFLKLSLSFIFVIF
jgi:hypothetical protein